MTFIRLSSTNDGAVQFS